MKLQPFMSRTAHRPVPLNLLARTEHKPFSPTIRPQPFRPRSKLFLIRPLRHEQDAIAADFGNLDQIRPNRIQILQGIDDEFYLVVVCRDESSDHLGSIPLALVTPMPPWVCVCRRR